MRLETVSLAALEDSNASTRLKPTKRLEPTSLNVLRRTSPGWPTATVTPGRTTPLVVIGTAAIVVRTLAKAALLPVVTSEAFTWDTIA